MPRALTPIPSPAKPGEGGQTAARLHQLMMDKRTEARAWTRAYGEDLPEVRDWAWAAR